MTKGRLGVDVSSPWWTSLWLAQNSLEELRSEALCSRLKREPRLQSLKSIAPAVYGHTSDGVKYTIKQRFL
jgi:hypothetical protein